MLPPTRVKLRARDEQDLRVIAAMLQDALVPLKDVAFLKREKRFVLVANRFLWERAPDEPLELPELEGDASFDDDAPPAPFERVNCGIIFDKVKSARTRGFDLANQEQILNLLTLEAEGNSIFLVFSGGAAIRLDVAGIHCHVEDLGEPWPADQRPEHELEVAPDPSSDPVAE